MVEADTTMQTVVKWDVCYNRDGGINFWAKDGSRTMREKSEKPSQKK